MGRARAKEVRKAIVDIQRCWKGYRARRSWPRRLRDIRWRTDAAVEIQRYVRGHLVRLALGKRQRRAFGLLWRRPLFERLKDQAAAIIQKW